MGCEQRGADGGGVARVATDDRAADQVRLQLEQPVVATRAAVGSELVERPLEVALEGADDVGDLVRDRLDRRERELRAPRRERETGDPSACVRPPPGRAETRERGDDVDAAGVGGGRGDELDLERARDAEDTRHPLDGRAAREDVPLERVGRPLAQPGDGRRESALRSAGFASRRRHHRAAGAVGRLGAAGAHAAEPVERSVGVGGHGGDRQLGEPADRRRLPERPVAGGYDGGQAGGGECRRAGAARRSTRAGAGRAGASGTRCRRR